MGQTQVCWSKFSFKAGITHFQSSEGFLNLIHDAFFCGELSGWSSKCRKIIEWSTGRLDVSHPWIVANGYPRKTCIKKVQPSSHSLRKVHDFWCYVQFSRKSTSWVMSHGSFSRGGCVSSSGLYGERIINEWRFKNSGLPDDDDDDDDDDDGTSLVMCNDHSSGWKKIQPNMVLVWGSLMSSRGIFLISSNINFQCCAKDMCGNFRNPSFNSNSPFSSLEFSLQVWSGDRFRLLRKNIEKTLSYTHVIKCE